MSVVAKLKYRIKNRSKEEEASFAFLIAAVMQRGVVMLATPIYTRIMPTEDFGTYSAYNAWFQILAILITLKISTGCFTQGLVKFDEEKDLFESSLIGITSVLGLGFLFLVFCFSNSIEAITGLPFKYQLAIIVESYLESIYFFWARREQYERRWKALLFLSVGVALSTAVISIVTISLVDNKVDARIFTIIAVYIIAYIPLIIGQFRRCKVFYDKSFWKYSLFFCIALIPHYLSQVVLNQSDRIMIERICGSSDAGIYSLAYSLAMIMLLINESIGKTLDPWLMKRIKNREFQRIAPVVYPLMVIVAVANLLLMVFAPEVIAVFAPPSYSSAKWIIPPVTGSVFFIFLYGIFADFEFYYEKTKLISLASVFSAILNIILNYIFVKIFGFIAAGYTTLICYFLYALVHYVFMNRICSNQDVGNRVFDHKLMALITIVFLILSAGISVLYLFNWLRYIIAVILALVILVCRNRISGYVLSFKEKN